MQVSLREQLEFLFPHQPVKVKQLLQEYWALVQINPHWRIGGFLQVIKKGRANG